MKIIEENHFCFEYACKYCKSKLIAEADDFRIGSFSSMGDSIYQIYVTCPVCTSDRIFEWGSVPPFIERLARSKGTK